MGREKREVSTGQMDEILELNRKRQCVRQKFVYTGAFLYNWKKSRDYMKQGLPDFKVAQSYFECVFLEP